jgi:hypothetical protein
LVSKNMNSRIWVVGCSITHGVGVTLEERWGHLVSQHLNLETQYLTAPGSSIEWATDQILQADIQPNDIVLWGMTTPSRYMYYDDNGQIQHVLNTYHDSNPDFNLIFDLARLTDNNLAYKAVNYVNQVKNFLEKIQCCYAIGYMLGGIQEHKQIILEKLSGPRFFVAFNNSPIIKTRLNFLQTVGPVTGEFIDTGSDGFHPGPEQHRVYAEKFLQQLEYSNY